MRRRVNFNEITAQTRTVPKKGTRGHHNSHASNFVHFFFFKTFYVIFDTSFPFFIWR